VSYNPPAISDEAIKMAKKFFQHAITVSDTRNYDYAIELFLQGLAKAPQAVEEGHKPLRETSLKRKVTGGKKAGLVESFKRTHFNGKDSTQGFINAEYLLAKDPLNVVHAEALVKCLDQAEYPEALIWALGVALDLIRQEKKINLPRLLMIANLYEKVGTYYDKQDKPDLAVTIYQSALSALETGIPLDTKQVYDFVGKQRDLAGRLTILRGRYERATGFQESIQNAEGQKAILDQDRIVKSEELIEQLLAKARGELQQNPDTPGKINAVVDLLLQRGKPADEQEAINLLQAAFGRTHQYALKFRADDVRIRQLTRTAQSLKEAAGQKDDPDLKTKADQAQKALDELDLEVWQERIKEYPTDTKMKFEYGRRLHKLKRFDEAIPVLQEVLSNPKYAVRARYYIGTAFFQKGWHSQAVDTLTEAIEGYEIQGDNLGKDMHYWLARSYEGGGQKDQALKTYSKLIQWDFNYRDARVRIDNLQKQA